MPVEIHKMCGMRAAAAAGYDWHDSQLLSVDYGSLIMLRASIAHND